MHNVLEPTMVGDSKTLAPRTSATQSNSPLRANERFIRKLQPSLTLVVLDDANIRIIEFVLRHGVESSGRPVYLVRR